MNIIWQTITGIIEVVYQGTESPERTLALLLDQFALQMHQIPETMPPDDNLEIPEENYNAIRVLVAERFSIRNLQLYIHALANEY